MQVKPITIEEYADFLADLYYTPFQSPQMYERLRLGGREPVLYGGFEDGKLKIALMGGQYPFKKLLKYIYVPYGPVSENPGDTELLARFFEALKKQLKKTNVVSIKFDTCVELMEMDPFGQVVEGGYDNHWYRDDLKKRGFIPIPLKYEMTTLENPRQVAIVDLAELKQFPGYATPQTEVEAMHAPAEQLAKMKNRTQRYIRTAKRPCIHIEEGTIEQLMEMGQKSGDARNFEFTSRKPLEDLKNGFQDACRIRHCYIDVPAFEAEIQEELKQVEEQITALEGKKVKKQLKMLEEKKTSLNKTLAEIQEMPGPRLSLACGMFLLAPKETFFLFSGMDRKYRKYQGETWLNWEMMQDSLARGVWRYNLLGIAGHYGKEDPNEGLISYKRDLGARIAEYTGTFYYPIQKQMNDWLIKTMEG